MKILILVILALISTEAYSSSLEYYINGDTQTATPLSGATISQDVNIHISGSYDDIIVFTWNNNPDPVDGYRIYYGKTMGSVTLARDVVKNRATFRAAAELKSNIGDNICFKVSAYNIIGESGLSEGACTVHRALTAVSFYLDDVSLATAPVATAAVYALDYRLPISGLSQGSHSMTMLVVYSDGSRSKATYDFSVNKPTDPVPSVPTGAVIKRGQLLQ